VLARVSMTERAVLRIEGMLIIDIACGILLVYGIIGLVNIAFDEIAKH
jgi:branched-subunit amino acid ABC-type transport system permease component